MNAQTPIRPFIPSVEEIAREMLRVTPPAKVEPFADPSPDFAWQQEGESLDPYEQGPFGQRRTV